MTVMIGVFNGHMPILLSVIDVLSVMMSVYKDIGVICHDYRKYNGFLIHSSFFSNINKCMLIVNLDIRKSGSRSYIVVL
jgi:hypothetical protein